MKIKLRGMRKDNKVYLEESWIGKNWSKLMNSFIDQPIKPLPEMKNKLVSLKTLKQIKKILIY